jgi:hypothetical protein
MLLPQKRNLLSDKENYLAVFRGIKQGGESVFNVAFSS